MNHMPNCLTMLATFIFPLLTRYIFMVPSETITHTVVLSNSWYSATRVGIDNIA